MAVRAFYHTDPEAPVLTGQVGTLVNLLKKCLVDGYGNVSQGTWKDPLGWAGTYDSVLQKAAFQSVAAGSPGHWLYVDDTGSDATNGAAVAGFRGYEGFGGFDGADAPVGLAGPFPLETEVSVCVKSQFADATSRKWCLIGDEQLFYLAIESNDTWPEFYVWHLFGDIVSLRPADGYHTMIVASAVTSAVNSVVPREFTRFHIMGGPTSSETGHWMARTYTQLGEPVPCGKMGDNGVNLYFGYGGYAFPTGPDNAMHIAPVRVVEGGFVRGTLPGLYQPLHARPLAPMETVAGVDGLAGRTLQGVPVAAGATNSYSNTGVAAVDITGPWR